MVSVLVLAANLLICTPYSTMLLGGKKVPVCFKVQVEDIGKVPEEFVQGLVDKAEKLSQFTF